MIRYHLKGVCKFISGIDLYFDSLEKNINYSVKIRQKLIYDTLLPFSIRGTKEQFTKQQIDPDTMVNILFQRGTFRPPRFGG